VLSSSPAGADDIAGPDVTDSGTADSTAADSTSEAATDSGSPDGTSADLGVRRHQHHRYRQTRRSIRAHATIIANNRRRHPHHQRGGHRCRRSPGSGTINPGTYKLIKDELYTGTGGASGATGKTLKETILVASGGKMQIRHLGQTAVPT